MSLKLDIMHTSTEVIDNDVDKDNPNHIDVSDDDTNDTNDINDTNNDIETHPLWNPFTLWFHKLFDNDWNDESYHKILVFDNVEDFWGLTDNMPCLKKGMFFMMKGNILPQWENEENKNGGYVSYKVHMSQAMEAWTEMSMSYIGGYITKDVNNLDYINGISISPKRYHCIIKVWINNHDWYSKYIENPTNLLSDSIKFYESKV